MNDDLLKSFVQEHRKEFDTLQAPSRVWDRVEKDLGESPKQNRWTRTSIWLVAVGISILFLGGIAIGLTGIHQQTIKGYNTHRLRMKNIRN